ncbi:hypothetical protein N7U49_05260 [Streptomyces sp. AD2-2]|nr:hypothetical protein N7U49_05260 [Streptomyces sp. AD2-2]
MSKGAARGSPSSEPTSSPAPPSSTSASTAPPDFRAAELDGIASRITPHRGVGPMTIAMLMVHTLRAAEWNAESEAVPA